MGKRLLPIHKIVRRLRKRWDPEEAQVLADWCEEHGLVSTARTLRKGPSARTRARIDALAMCFGDRGMEMVHWQFCWLPGYKPTRYEAKLLRARFRPLTDGKNGAWVRYRLERHEQKMLKEE